MGTYKTVAEGFSEEETQWVLLDVDSLMYPSDDSLAGWLLNGFQYLIQKVSPWLSAQYHSSVDRKQRGLRKTLAVPLR